ncbi:MAG: GAF domain-containing protein, partial [Anaerolineae bacterium]|nr:GAF domain-containing protein [Anaerolineae bacterium]
MSVKQDFAPPTRVVTVPKVRPRLRTRVTIALVALNLLTLLAFIIVVSLFVLRPYLRQQIRSRHQDAVALAALSLDTDAVAQLVAAEPGPSATLDSVIAQLRVARDRISGARFAYLMRQGADGKIYFVADAEEVPEDASPPGSVYDDPGPLLAQSIGALASAAVEEDFYEDQWGVWLSGYAPLRAADGTLVAVLGVDLEATDVRRQELAFVQVGAIAMLVAAPLTVFVGLALGRRLTAHLGTLVSAVERVRAGDLNYETPIPEEEEAAQLATAFNEMTRRLRETVSGLEERVTARTSDLERQAAYLRATGEVSRVAASILDLDDLLTQVATLISDQFGFYHAGVFLLDDTREWAVLRAASSAGGQRMVARGHRLGVGAQGIVGYVTQTGRPRIALDVGDDMVWFDNPDLPETHSEMALPLIVGEQVIGALDVQSQETDAFKNED